MFRGKYLRGFDFASSWWYPGKHEGNVNQLPIMIQVGMTCLDVRLQDDLVSYMLGALTLYSAINRQHAELHIVVDR